jgi:hypothetical protein
MKDLDQHITDAIHSENAESLLEREDPGAIEELLATFQGSQRGLMYFAFVLSVGMFGIATWAGFRFYHAETVGSQLSWGGLCLLGLLMVSFIKVYFWMEMHSQRILREIKRTELRLMRQLESRR